MVRKTSNPSWRTGTNLVRGGTNRSDFAETNEAIFITSGYVYESAEPSLMEFLMADTTRLQKSRRTVHLFSLF